ncbi:MAG: Hsp20/alpha crystallin family protein [Gemmatimonadaceae bacterium]
MVRSAALTAPFFGLRREIDRLFEDTLGGTNPTMDRMNAWMPVGDVKETKDALLFELEVPGVAEDKLDISCEGGVLTIAGEKETVRKEGDEGRYHIVERSYGMFRRSFQLPTNVQEDKIEATVKGGVLTVKVPKMELPKPKKIEVKAVKQ